MLFLAMITLKWKKKQMVRIAKATVTMRSRWNQLPMVKFNTDMSADEENLQRAQGARHGIARERGIMWEIYKDIDPFESYYLFTDLYKQYRCKNNRTYLPY